MITSCVINITETKYYEKSKRFSLSAIWLALRMALHLGPCLLVGLSLLGLTTGLHCIRTLWPDNINGASYCFALTAIGTLLFVSVLVLAFLTMITGPGYVPYGWKPDSAEECGLLSYCKSCRGYKPPRAHHCVICGRCVMKMDHHCPWLNSCVGHKNHTYFVYFLLSTMIGVAYAVSIIAVVISAKGSLLGSLLVLLMRLVFGELTRVPVHLEKISDPLMALSELALILMLVVFAGVVVMLLGQVAWAAYNSTFLETQVIKEAKRVRKNKFQFAKEALLARKQMGYDVDGELSQLREEPFENPYSFGVVRNLLMMLLPCATSTGDGFSYPVRPGYDQYTLQREHLRQKKERRSRMVEYVTIDDYSGSLLPLEKGVCLTLLSPIMNWSRLQLQHGDVIQAFPTRSYWLYGEKVVDQNTGAVVKGWVPSRCVVQRVEKKDI